MTEPGTTTQDILTLGQPHPAEPTSGNPGLPEREHLNRRYARICLAVGLAFITGTLLAAALQPDRAPEQPVNVAYAAFTMAGIVVGAIGITIYAVEVLTRYNRTLTRQLRAQHDDTLQDIIGVRSVLLQVVRDNRRLLALAQAQDDRMSRMEQSIAEIPGYGQGVIDGAMMRRAAISDDPD